MTSGAMPTPGVLHFSPMYGKAVAGTLAVWHHPGVRVSVYSLLVLLLALGQFSGSLLAGLSGALTPAPGYLAYMEYLSLSTALFMLGWEVRYRKAGQVMERELAGKPVEPYLVQLAEAARTSVYGVLYGYVLWLIMLPQWADPVWRMAHGGAALSWAEVWWFVGSVMALHVGFDWQTHRRRLRALLAEQDRVSLQ